MTLHGPEDVFFLSRGYDLLAAMLSDLRSKITVITQAIGAPLGARFAGWEVHKRTGVKSCEITQAGAFFNTADDNIHEAFKGISDPDAADPNLPGSVSCIGLGGVAAGSPFLGFDGDLTESYEPISQTTQLVRANVTHKASGKAENGVVVHALTLELGDMNTEGTPVDNALNPNDVPIGILASSVANPSVIHAAQPHLLTSGDTVIIGDHAGSTPNINGERTVTVIDDTHFSVPVNVTVGGAGGSFKRGKTQGGGAGYVQIPHLVLGGHTSARLTFRDSADGVVFADLLVMTDVTEEHASERKEFTGPVRRFLALDVAFQGAGASPEIEVFAGLARG